MADSSRITRVVKDIERAFTYHLKERLVAEVPNFKDLILTGFDGLSDRITDPNSNTDPALFRKIFQESLDAFKFIGEHPTTGVRIILPDLLNFDFNGMKIIERILEGTPGTYVEVSHDDLEKITGKTTINADPIDSTVPRKKRVYIIQYTPSLKNKEKTVLSRELIKFPFSNVPPLEDEVFGAADEYYEENIDAWIDEANEKSTRLIKTKY
jgi:hypothetical protein